MLNSPCNPTGTVYTRQEQEALADIVLDADIAVLSDEIYERLVYGDAKNMKKYSDDQGAGRLDSKGTDREFCNSPPYRPP